MPLAVFNKDIPDHICGIIEDASEFVLLICPFMKIADTYRKSLEKLRAKPGVKLTILYGGWDITADKEFVMNDYDLKYLRTLPNIEIRRWPNLHAKHYANENNFLTTSMNISWSVKYDNSECGILFRKHQDSYIWSNLETSFTAFTSEIFTRSEIIEPKSNNTLPD